MLVSSSQNNKEFCGILKTPIYCGIHFSSDDVAVGRVQEIIYSTLSRNLLEQDFFWKKDNN